MPHTLISISSPEYGNIPFQFSPAIEEQNVMILQSNQSFGSIHWVIEDYDNYNIWTATYKITHPLKLKISVRHPYLGFIFSLKNEVKYDLQNLNPISIPELKYDMLYMPSTELQYTFDPETYIICGFNYKTSAFKAWNKLFQSLESFLSAINSKRAFRLKKVPITPTPRILAPLFHIIHCRYQGTQKGKFINFKTSELTFYALQNMALVKTESTISPKDLTLMMEVKDHLLNNLNTTETIRELALRFGLNDFKLKSTFKQAFHTSIYAFLLEERLQNALTQILETDMPLTQIAELTGYSDLSAFSTAFKKRFGYRPSTLR